MYDIGVAKDPVEAVKWYHKAAEQGLAGAQFSLGLCFMNGDGVAKDPVEAVKWYHMAAEQGHAMAQDLERLTSKSIITK
jgi:TPR repeat protein